MTDVKNTPGSEGGEGANVIPPAGGQPVVPGTKTDPALLLQSLQDERDKRRLAEDAKATVEAELQRLKDALASGDTSSEESKILKEQITGLQGQITEITTENTLKDLQVKYPALQGKVSEFKEFRKTNPAGSEESALKVFLAENNLFETPAPRKGLEVPSGGGRTNTPTTMTHAEVADLRKNNFRLYTKLLREGKIPDMSE